MIVVHASRLKVGRAKQHIADLNRQIAVYKREDPNRLVENRESQPGDHFLRIHERIKPPEDWPLIVGDTIHNLRSALDILACDLLRAFGRKNVRNVYFPFAKSADRLDDTIKQRMIGKTRPYIVNAFRALNAHKGGNWLLYAIHEMDLMDNHQLLITINQPAGVRNLKITSPSGRVLVNTEPGVTLMFMNQDRIMFTAKTAENLKFQYERKIAFEVLFDIGTGDRKPIVPTLMQMTQLVGEIIGLIEGHVNNPQPTIFLEHRP